MVLQYKIANASDLCQFRKKCDTHICVEVGVMDGSKTGSARIVRNRVAVFLIASMGIGSVRIM